MRLRSEIIGVLALASVAAPAASGQEGSAPLLCAVTHTVACDQRGDCSQGPASAVNLPVFVKVDAASKSITSAREGGERRTSEALEVRTSGDTTVLTGLELLGGWTVIVNRATGQMTATVAEQGTAYIVFGACLPL
jgi:hypothetical protein